MKEILFKNIPEDIIKISNLFMNNKSEIYLVGGCVRDMLLNETPHDYDLCTNLKPDEIISLLQNNHIPYHTVGIEFGTITAILNNEEYEITTYRGESSYSDNRKPDEVYFINNIYDDLSRRDFSINAMAYNPITKELIDIYHGKDDLKNHIIRAVGNADDRIKEDSLRILRAIRFAIKYNFEIENETEKAILNNYKNINNISKERITDEFRKIFESNKSILKPFLKYHCVISEIIPEIKECIGFNQNNKYHQYDVYEHCLRTVDSCNTNDFIIKMAALLHDIGKPYSYSEDELGYGHFYGHPERSYEICETLLKNNFRLTKDETNQILCLVKNHDVAMHLSDKSARKLLSKVPENIIHKWFILKQADIDNHINLGSDLTDNYVTSIKKYINNFLEQNKCLKPTDLAIKGTDILDLLNEKPGPIIKETQNHLVDLVFDEKIPNEENFLIAEAFNFLFIKNANVKISDKLKEIIKNNQSISFELYTDLQKNICSITNKDNFSNKEEINR